MTTFDFLYSVSDRNLHARLMNSQYQMNKKTEKVRYKIEEQKRRKWEVKGKRTFGETSGHKQETVNETNNEENITKSSPSLTSTVSYSNGTKNVT